MAPCAVQETGPRAPEGWPATVGINTVWCDRVKAGNGGRDIVALSHLAKPRRRDGRGDGRNLVLVTVQPRAQSSGFPTAVECQRQKGAAGSKDDLVNTVEEPRFNDATDDFPEERMSPTTAMYAWRRTEPGCLPHCGSSRHPLLIGGIEQLAHQVRSSGREQPDGGQHLPIGPILGQQVDSVSAVIRVHLHVSEDWNLPPCRVHEYSLALATHLYEVRLEEPTGLLVDDDNHPSLLTSVHWKSMRGAAELGNTPDQGYWRNACGHAGCIDESCK